jgi:hypothetical protein
MTARRYDAVRNLDIDFQGRYRFAAVELDLHLVGLERHVPADHGEDFLAQYAEQVGLIARPALVGEQDLQAFARNGRAAAASEYFEEGHAAFRPNSLLKMPLFSVGTTIGTTSPRSRRAASK